MELYRSTIHELSDKLKKKEISSTEITKSVLERIDAVEKKIDAYITVLADEALAAAKKVDEKIAKNEEISPIAGIPMGIKDNICTKGALTTCASKILHNFVPPYDATVAGKLKQNDAVIIGKCNMDEFAMGSSTENSYFKKTKNPHDTSKVPGGSSGGSAAAVTADEAIFSLGSDTGGSIRQPASYCGCVGLKPTYGSVSRYGLVAFASSLDQIGPLTKDVTDCAIVLNAITGYDEKDSTSVKYNYPDYTKALKNDIKGLKIAVPKEYIGEGINPEVKNAILKSLETLKALGADYEEVSLPLNEYALAAYYIISSAEASSNLARYDGIKYGYRADKFENLIDLYCKTRSEGFGAEVKRRIMLGTYVLSAGYYDAYYKKAQQVRTLITNDFNKVLSEYDVIITPTAPTTAFGIGEKISDPLTMYLEDICTVSLNIAGLPGMVVPCGFDSANMPIGMQIIGKAFDEGTLLNTAYTFEQNTDFHKIKPVI